MTARRLPSLPISTLVIAAAASVVVANAEGWRIAALAALAAGAVAATRVRFADWAALGLLGLVAVVVSIALG